MTINSPERYLIWGNDDYLTAAVVQRLLDRTQADLVLANSPNIELTSHQVSRIQCDRNDSDQCSKAIGLQTWQRVIDLTASNHQEIENIVANCRFEHYTFFSSSTVDLSWPDDQLFNLAQNKLWCEHLLQNATSKLLVVRTGYIVGEPGNSGRFENRGGVWFWKGNNDPVQPAVDVHFLSGLSVELIIRQHTGVVRAGYSNPRVGQPTL